MPEPFSPLNAIPLRLVVGLYLLGLVGACSVTPDKYERPVARPEPRVVIDNERVMQEVNALKISRRIKDDILRLYDADPIVRAGAAEQLAKLGRGAKPAVPHLVHLLGDDEPAVLSRYLGGGYHSQSATTPGDEAMRSLGRIGSEALPELSQAATSPSEVVRRRAIKALGQIGDLSSLELLVMALADPNRQVQASATMALGSYRHPMAAQSLMDRFPQVSESARVHLVYALAQINDILAVPFLIEQVNAPSVELRAAIALALGKLRDGRAFASLCSMTEDPDEIVRANAVYSLGAFYTPEVIDLLINRLQDPVPRVRNAAAESLSGLTGLQLGENRDDWQRWWLQQKTQMRNGKQSSQ